MKAAATAAEEKSPDWLPEGWAVEIREGDDGEKVKCYISPVPEHTFYSKQEVLHHHGVTKVDGHTSDAAPISKHNEMDVAPQVRNSPEWLPHGWILEIRARQTGDKAGQKYKSYFDPFSGSRFYSKAEALRFLKSRDPCTPTSGEKNRFKANTPDNVISQIEYSPDGLPHGWIKETVFRKSKSRSTGIKKDPYYTDPISGYVFRSFKEAKQYVKTGKPGKYAIGPRKSSAKGLYSLEKKSPPSVPAKEVKSQARTVHCLSKEEASASNGESTIEINESHGEEKPKQTRSTRNSFKPENDKQRGELLERPSHENGMIEIKSQGEEKPKQSRLTRNRSKLQNEKKSEELLGKPPNESSKSNEKGTTETNKSQQEEKPKRGRPPNKRPRPENEKESEELLEKPVNGSIEINETQEEEKPKQSTPFNKKSKSEKKKEPTRPETIELVHQQSTPFNNQGLENHSQRANEITPVTKERKLRKSKGASIAVPRRSSKRLAGLDPTPTTELVISNRDHNNETKEPVPSAEPETTNTIEAASQREQQVLIPSTEPGTINTVEEASHREEVPQTEQTSSFALPFVNAWDDPCIEFAVKTLMGEIPLLDEGLAIEEYFQKQRSTAEASIMPSTSNNQGLDTGKLVGPEELPKELHFSVNNDEGKSCSLENGMPSKSNAEASRVRG
ncbi:methyl-CpG-binding domain-containing protein 13 [Asparagus officinalis]|uniref:methyl-CpG-binding domain-containing protein 13 n=1 Tax=Asparagus officinalis TaxID=4686 RepID=UPI00098E64A1|nr:methyl-CpG-binding domain-containing protein 13 [Asparagus officinalis]